MLDEDIRIEGRFTAIRPFREWDITDAYLSWLNDSETMRYSNQRFITHTRKSALDYLTSFVGTSNRFFAVEDSNTSKVIGTMTAYYLEREGVVDLGILVGDKASAGKGFGKDCWCAMIEWLQNQDNVRKITAGTVSINEPMLALMRSSKMLEDGRRKKHQIIDGQPVDVLYAAIFTDV